jgi:hypothetical protein
MNNVTLISHHTDTAHVFDLNHDDKQYRVTVFLDEKGKFADWFVEEKFDDDETEPLIAEFDDEIIGKLIDYVDANWDALTA